MARQSSPAGRSSVPALVLVGLGAFLITIALALVFFVVPAQKKTPLDTVATTITDTVPGTVLIGKALAGNTPTESNKDRPECKPAPAPAPERAEGEPADGADAEGEPADAAAPDGAADKPSDAPLPVSCFIDAGIPMYSQRHVSVVEPSDADELTLQAAQTVMRTDRQGGTGQEDLVSATLDRVTLDRVTAEPVPAEVSSLSLLPDSGEAPTGFARSGHQYKFPFDTKKQSYDYFDASTFTTHPLDYVGESTIAGIDTYEFRQELGPIDMFQALRDHFASLSQGYDKSVEGILASYRRKDSTAGVWGLPGDPARRVDMHRYYTNTRTLFVNPETGRIILGREDILQFFAESQQEADAFWNDKAAVDAERRAPKRTAFALDAGWDTETVEETAVGIQENLDKLNTFGRVLPGVLTLLGVLAVGSGLFLGLRTPEVERRRRKR